MQLNLNRRTLVAVLGAAAACAASDRSVAARSMTAPGLAITIDDFDLADTPLLSGVERDASIRAALKRHGIKAAGFVAGKYVDAIIAPEVLRRWASDGHIIGNHSFSHRNFDGSYPDRLMSDILKCETLLSGYAGFRKLFRFPYLAEGKTAEGRDAMRALLDAHGYRNAHVTIDTSDWFIDNRLKARLKIDPNANLSPYRRFYLDHLWERATYYDGLANSLLGHSIDHTMLLHHRLTTGLFLDDALRMFQARGWRIIDASAAFRSPTLSLVPQALPAGQSLIWALAKADTRFATSLRYPGEDGNYEAPNPSYSARA